jgi:hypothetical protein
MDVRLVDAAARTAVRDPKAIPKPVLVTSHGSKVIQRSSDRFIVGVQLQAQVVSEGEGLSPDSPIFMHVTFALEYHSGEISRFPDSVLEEFARVNGVYNAWPYLREYVQTTVSRMNLPPLLLPLLRVGPPAVEQKRDSGIGEKRLRPAAPVRLKRQHERKPSASIRGKHG